MEKDEPLLNLIERFSEVDEEHQRKSSEKKLKAEDDIAKAQERWEKCIKTFWESKNKKDPDNCDGDTKRTRKSSTDLVP